MQPAATMLKPAPPEPAAPAIVNVDRPIADVAPPAESAPPHVMPPLAAAAMVGEAPVAEAPDVAAAPAITVRHLAEAIAPPRPLVPSTRAPRALEPPPAHVIEPPSVPMAESPVARIAEPPAAIAMEPPAPRAAEPGPAAELTRAEELAR